MIIGLSRERKSPPDNRVALSPIQCVALQQRYPQVKVQVESSPTRCFSDEAYREVGIEVVDDLGRCDVIFNIKEVPSEALIAGKTYIFFSHTIKKQPYNRTMLQSILKKQITLIDYEVLRYETGARVLGFGRYAGVIGTYNGLLVYGKKHGLYSLKPAHQSKNYADILTQLLRVDLPNIRIAVTGGGRVSQGALDLLRALQIREVTPNQYLHVEYGEPVFVQLNSPDLYVHPSLTQWDTQHFYKHHGEYKSQFKGYAERTDLLVNGIYWTEDLPRLFEVDDTEDAVKFAPTVIADISCDVEGSVPITYRATSIADPVIGWSRLTGSPCEPYTEGSIDVMAVGNLPNELPKDASEEFGEMLLQHVIPELMQGKSRLIEEATIAKGGTLTTHFSYLSDFVADIPE
ncbi:MAG: NAD(P)-dependent oxidoreductase [Bacteroidota bacterium]